MNELVGLRVRVRPTNGSGAFWWNVVIDGVSECGRFVRVKAAKAFGRRRWVDLTIDEIEEGRTMKAFDRGKLGRAIAAARFNASARLFVEAVELAAVERRGRGRRIRVGEL